MTPGGALGASFLFAIGAAMAVWTWGSWPDLLVDFGRELYVPWRLGTGAVLYRDIAWFNGPLSPYLNALWFGLFGTGLRTLVWANLVLLALLVFLLHRWLRALASPVAATAACSFFLLVYAFGQYLPVGNYNYVCPYSHEATHGLLLSVACLVMLEAWSRRRRRILEIGAGIALGLVLLTKAEVTFALAPAAFLLLLLGGEGDGKRGTALGVFAGAAIAPPLIAFLLLWAAMPAGDALRGALGTWTGLLGTGVAELPYYRLVSGLDHPSLNLAASLRWAGGWSVSMLPGVALAMAAGRWPAAQRALALTAALAGGLLLLLKDHIPWLHLMRPLPLVAALFVVGAGLAWRRASGQEARRRASIALAASVFALLLLAKIGLSPFVAHYGFTLTVPAALLAVVALLDWIPRALAARGARPLPFQAGALALLCVVCAAYLEQRARWNARDFVAVGEGVDRFRSDERGHLVGAVLAHLETLPPEASVAVVPEGVMLNYLARRPTATPDVNFMPPELELFDEARIVERFEESPPALVVWIDRDTPEYGVTRFGRDYGEALATWIEDHYEESKRFGGAAQGFDQPPFAIRLLDRADLQGDQSP